MSCNCILRMPHHDRLMRLQTMHELVHLSRSGQAKRPHAIMVGVDVHRGSLPPVGITNARSRTCSTPDLELHNKSAMYTSTIWILSIDRGSRCFAKVQRDAGGRQMRRGVQVRTHRDGTTQNRRKRRHAIGDVWWL